MNIHRDLTLSLSLSYIEVTFHICSFQIYGNQNSFGSSDFAVVHRQPFEVNFLSCKV